MTRVLIIRSPSPLSVYSGVVVGSQHVYMLVRLDHYAGEVLCKPSELCKDVLPRWVPVWLNILVSRIYLGARRYHEDKQDRKTS